MKKFLALFLAAVMCLAALAGCAPAPVEPTDPSAPVEPTEPTKDPNTPLVVGYSPFSSKFSPFFASTAYDQDAQAMTQISLLNLDRVGAVVEKGIEGEVRNYNGTDYTYYGPSDLTITMNEDGTVYYDFQLREDITFSDGVNLTADDVIFSMYVTADPTFDGPSTFSGLPIVGMDEYRSGMDILSALIASKGEDNTDFSLFTEEQATAFWTAVNEGGAAFAQGIVDYCVENGYNEAGDVAGAAGNWGFGGLAADATAKDFFMAIGEAYGWNFSAMEPEVGNSEPLSTLIADVYNYSTMGVKTGESADSITGIQKTGDYSLRVVTTNYDANVIYSIGVEIAPMHYYGDASLYDYDNNMFGFNKGDLSIVREKTTQPMGAGAYKLIKFENGVINFEANENYYLGAPKTKYINFAECLADDDKLNGVVTGTIDITDPSLSNDTVDAIKAANGNDELSGAVVETNLVNNQGYGYLGLSAYTIKVGEDGGSEESKNLRKAFATLFSVYRDVAIDSYYGDRANVINYPISDTSWAAPRPSDDDYKLAFSTKLDGSDIYTSEMTAEERYAAALEAAMEYFEAAGYTVEDGKLTAAPEGAKLEYTMWIPGDGIGDHPNFMICTLTKEALASVGMNLIIKDLTNSSELWDALDAQQADMWTAAWQSTPDPDMYQIYYADTANADGTGKNPWGGPKQGGDSYRYCIADEELDQLIMDARSSADQTYRKAMYKACLDIVIDWATEIPSYQRQNCIIFSAERVNLDTVTPDITPYYPWTSEIEKVELA